MVGHVARTWLKKSPCDRSFCSARPFTNYSKALYLQQPARVDLRRCFSTCQNRTQEQTAAACLLLYRARSVRKGEFHCRKGGDQLGELFVRKELRQSWRTPYHSRCSAVSVGRDAADSCSNAFSHVCANLIFRRYHRLDISSPFYLTHICRHTPSRHASGTNFSSVRLRGKRDGAASCSEYGKWREDRR